MVVILRDPCGESLVELEVEEGSHIFLKRMGADEEQRSDEVFMEWRDAPEGLRREALASIEKLAKAISECSEKLWAQTSTQRYHAVHPANVVELSAHRANHRPNRAGTFSPSRTR